MRFVAKGYGRCCHGNYRAHMRIPDVTTTPFSKHARPHTRKTVMHSLALPEKNDQRLHFSMSIRLSALGSRPIGLAW